MNQQTVEIKVSSTELKNNSLKTLGLMTLVQLLCFLPTQTFAKNTTVRKVQEVNFAEMDLKGTVRNPDGAYLVQKRGIKFMPLYDMQKDMDAKIRNSIVYAK